MIVFVLQQIWCSKYLWSYSGMSLSFLLLRLSLSYFHTVSTNYLNTVPSLGFQHPNPLNYPCISPVAVFHLFFFFPGFSFYVHGFCSLPTMIPLGACLSFMGFNTIYSMTIPKCITLTSISQVLGSYTQLQSWHFHSIVLKANQTNRKIPNWIPFFSTDSLHNLTMLINDNPHRLLQPMIWQNPRLFSQPIFYLPCHSFCNIYHPTTSHHLHCNHPVSYHYLFSQIL